MYSGNKELQQAVQHALFGHLNQRLPSPKTRTLKIVLISSFSDFDEEREIIWTEILPELQQYCLHYGSELNMVDPLLGITSESTATALLSQNMYLLTQEIQSARDLSMGIFFLCLIGDKYGIVPLPVTIRHDEFGHIRQCAFEAGKDVKLLDETYKLDNNAVPPVYRLEITPTIGGKAISDVQAIIQTGALLAHKEGFINQVDAKRQERYFSSWTEQCVKVALSYKDDFRRSLFVLRKLDGLRQAAKNINKKPTDMSKEFTSLVDMPSSPTEKGVIPSLDKVETIKNTLSENLDKPNLETFTVPFAQPWQSSKERANYLEQFAPHLTYKLKQLIDGGSDRFHPSTSWKHRVAEEAVLHADYCIRHRSNNLLGQKELLRKIGELCKNVQKKKTVSTLAIVGEEGSGKTALLCEIAHQLSSWFGTDPVTVLRFVGVGPQTYMAHELLASLCQQISLCYELDTSSNTESIIDVRKLCQWFLATLTEVGSDNKKKGASRPPLVILIDDLDLLKNGYHLNVNDLSWLPSTCPSNCLIIFTMSKLANHASLPVKSLDSKAIFELTALPEKILVQLVKELIPSSHRTLTPEQSALLAQCVHATPSPLYASLLAAHATEWTSYSAPNGTGLPTNISGFVEYILQTLEQTFGQTVLAYVCSCIECSLYGLTETELLDLMSNSQDTMSASGVTDEARVQRFPSMTWIKLKNGLSHLLETIVCDGCSLLRWKHSTIRAAVKHRYLQTSQKRKAIHTDMAEMFSNLWTEQENPSLQDGESNVHLFMPRPLKSVSDGVVYNIRRIRELWFHLLNSGSLELLKEQALCNFDYLEAISHSCGLSHLLSVLEGTMYHVFHHDFQFLFNIILSPALPTLAKEPLLLASEFIGRLRYLKDVNSPYLSQLVEQAMAWVDNYYWSPLLVPLTSWAKPPRCDLALNFEIEWKGGNIIVQPTRNYQHLLLAGENDNGMIRMYHLSSQVLVRSFQGHAQRILCITLSRDGQFFVTSSVDKTIKTWDLIQGSCLRNLSPHSEKTVCLALARDDTRLVSGSHDRTAKVISLETGRVIRTFEHSGPVLSLALTEDDEILVTGADDFYVRVWVLNSGEIISQISGLMAPVTRLTLSSNDAFLLVACEDETLHVMSLCSATQLHELRAHEGKVVSIAIAHDDCQAYVGCSDGKIYIYDIHTKELLGTRSCGAAPVSTVKATSDGHFMVSGCAKDIHVWNVEHRKHKPTTTFEAIRKPSACKVTQSGVYLSCMEMAKTGKHAVTGFTDGRIEFWDLETCIIIWRVNAGLDLSKDTGAKDTITAMAFTADTSYLISGTDQGSLCVWATLNGSLVKQYTHHHSPIKNIRLFVDGLRICSHDASDQVHVWNMIDPAPGSSAGSTSGSVDEVIVSFKGVRDLIQVVNNDNDFIGKSAEMEKEARIWSIQGDLATVRGKLSHVDGITCVLLSQDGKSVVTASLDMSLKVWETATGFLTQVLVGHDAKVTCCAVSSDGKLVISGSEDKTVICWDIDTGSARHTYRGHMAAVSSLAITADLTVVISGSLDGWLYVWSLEKGTYITSFNAHQPILEVMLSADASRVLLRLERCEYFPILCLHNTPAGVVAVNQRKGRTTSISSTGSSVSLGSALTGNQDKDSVNSLPSKPLSTAAPGAHNLGKVGAAANQPAHSVFAQLERSRSRASLFTDQPTMSTRLSQGKTEKTSGEAKSNVCSIV